MSNETTITINTAEISDAIAHRMMYGEDGVRARTESKIEALAAAEFEKTSRAAVDDEIRSQVGEQLASGFQRTDEWGQPRGERVTLAQLVASYMTERVRDPLNDSFRREAGERTRAEWMIRDMIKHQLGQAFDEEIKRGQQAIRAAIDDIIKAKLAETLKSALGLR